MNDELKAHYEKVLKIRDQAAARMIKVKDDYIASGKNDEFMLSMLDEHITFLQKSVNDMCNVVKKNIKK